jgi:hypothetical protein
VRGAEAKVAMRAADDEGGCERFRNSFGAKSSFHRAERMTGRASVLRAR